VYSETYTSTNGTRFNSDPVFFVGFTSTRLEFVYGRESTTTVVSKFYLFKLKRVKNNSSTHFARVKTVCSRYKRIVFRRDDDNFHSYSYFRSVVLYSSYARPSLPTACSYNNDRVQDKGWKQL